MSSVPPPERPTNNHSPKRGEDGPRRSDSTKDKGKEFRLPSKEEKDDQSPKEKKKNLFDLAGEAQVKQLKGEISESELEGIQKAEKLDAAQAKQISQVTRLIIQLVESMHIGTLAGKDFASLNLSRDPAIPEAFAGSNLTLNYQENGLVIRFDNFVTPQQEIAAIAMIEKNQEQLAAMVHALQVKNIQVAELNIGNRQVPLPPRVEPLPPPMQAFQAESPDARAQQERERQEREEKE